MSSTTSSTTASSTRSSTSRPHFDAEQREHLAIISAEFARARLPPGLAAAIDALTLAAAVNAWHESRLRARAHATGIEDSIGLFQINRWGELGSPYSREQLRNPTTNTRVILLEVVHRQVELTQAGTVEELTAAFCAHVERPKDRFSKGLERGRTVRSWWGPGVADAPAVGWRA